MKPASLIVLCLSILILQSCQIELADNQQNSTSESTDIVVLSHPEDFAALKTLKSEVDQADDVKFSPEQRSILREISAVNPIPAADYAISSVNPSRAEILAEMKRLGSKYQIPFEVFYAIAVSETGGYNGGVPAQFWPAGSRLGTPGQPIVSGDDGIGIMQVTPWAISQTFDRSRLLNDWRYNLEAGAMILKSKWEIEKRYTPIGNMDPNILEHWYVAAWAYNGLSQVNNPNEYLNGPRRWSNGLISWTRNRAYQDDIVRTIQREFGVTISTIPRQKLPATGSSTQQIIAFFTNRKFDTPTPFHYTGQTSGQQPPIETGELELRVPAPIIVDSVATFDLSFSRNIDQVKRQINGGNIVSISKEDLLNGAFDVKFGKQTGERKMVLWGYDKGGREIASLQTTFVVLDQNTPDNPITINLPKSVNRYQYLQIDGDASYPIAQVRVTVDNWQIPSQDLIPVNNGHYEFNYAFSAAAANRKVVVEGFDDQSRLIAVYDTTIDVLGAGQENPASVDIFFPSQINQGQLINVSGTAQGNVAYVQVLVDDWQIPEPKDDDQLVESLIKVDNHAFEFDYTFTSSGMNRHVEVKGFNEQGIQVASFETSIDVLGNGSSDDLDSSISVKVPTGIKTNSSATFSFTFSSQIKTVRAQINPNGVSVDDSKWFTLSTGEMASKRFDVPFGSNSGRRVITLQGLNTDGVVIARTDIPFTVESQNSGGGSITHQQLFNYLSSSSNRADVMREATRLRGATNNTCAYFAAEALRRIGVNIPRSVSLTDGYSHERSAGMSLHHELAIRGWKVGTDLSKVKPGYVMFSNWEKGWENVSPAHVYVFMSWETTGSTAYGYIVDNQTTNGSHYHRRNITATGPKTPYLYYMYKPE